ncbi:MAG: GMC oxidoreductase [Polyangiaceae bacterium]
MTVPLEVVVVPEIEVDALVVGSGFGGSVAACRLAQAGFDVLVLERGRRFEAGDFPHLPGDDALLPDTRRWAWSDSQGLWDVVDLGEVVSAQAAGYGGGSLIYANVHLRPPPQVFDRRWPTEYENGAILDEFYDLAASMLDVAPITQSKPLAKSIVKSTQLYGAMKALNREKAFFHPPLAVNYEERTNAHGVRQNACTGCGACCTGCPEKAKSTLDYNYLAVAERAGARAKTECEVLGFQAIDRGEYRYRIQCLDHLEARTYYVDTKFLFLCAGSIHSTRLLAGAKLKRDERLKQLVGVGYFPGGDALGIVYDTKEAQEPSFGPAITTTTVHWRSREKGSFFLLQDGGYARELTRLMGALRAPAWLGRNRLTKTRGKGAASPPRVAAAALAGEPTVSLRSMPDDLMAAVATGYLGFLSTPHVRSVFTSLLQELKNPLLLPFVVDGTIARGISDRYVRWFHRRLTPGKKLLGHLAALEEWFIHRLYAGSDGLALGALRAIFDRGDLSATEVAAKTLNYDASGAQHRLMLLAMGRDAAPGHLKYDPETSQLVADLNLHRLAPGYVEEERLMADVALKLDGELRTNPAWAFLGKPITVHNQGGCHMSTSADEGVTGPNGQVHGQEGLYVMDAAVFCTSVGVNPSATILAISERNILSFIKSQLGENWETSEARGAKEYRRQREAASKWRQLADAQKWTLSPPELTTTEFTSPSLGIEFVEQMVGYFTPNIADPKHDDDLYREYETRGRPNHYLDVKLHIAQPDLASFFFDPFHRLSARGTAKVKLPGITELEHAVTGTLELFAPQIKAHAIRPEEPLRLNAQRRLDRDYCAKAKEDDPTRFLKYSLSFEKHPGWRLEGYKRISDKPGLGAWRDVSCLFVELIGPAAPEQVANGVNGAQPVLYGAGAIHVDLFQFLHEQVPSIRATGTNDEVREAWAVANFAQFFFVSLQRIYLPELNALLAGLMRKAS